MLQRRVLGGKGGVALPDPDLTLRNMIKATLLGHSKMKIGLFYGTTMKVFVMDSEQKSFNFRLKGEPSNGLLDLST